MEQQHGILTFIFLLQALFSVTNLFANPFANFFRDLGVGKPPQAQGPSSRQGQQPIHKYSKTSNATTAPWKKEEADLKSLFETSIENPQAQSPIQFSRQKEGSYDTVISKFIDAITRLQNLVSTSPVVPPEFKEEISMFNMYADLIILKADFIESEREYKIVFFSQPNENLRKKFFSALTKAEELVQKFAAKVAHEKQEQGMEDLEAKGLESPDLEVEPRESEQHKEKSKKRFRRQSN
jgi:hypothetical protein